MHFGVAEIVVGVLVVSVGAVLQGSVGFGLNLLSAPFIALVAPEALPATLTMVALPLAIGVLAREHHAVDWPLLRWMLVGSIPGTLVGLVVVDSTSPHDLSMIIGGITIVSVVLSVLRVDVRVTPVSAVIASVISNVFGTAAAVGGPPVALLLQHHPGPTTRATLSGFFLTSTVTSLVGYALTDELHGYQALYALMLIPAMGVGLWVSRHLHGHVDGGWLRPGILVLSAIAGTAALVNGLT